MTTDRTDWFAFNDAGRPVAVANGEHYPSLGAIILEDPDPSSPWVKYRDIRLVSDQAERRRLLDIMAGRDREGTPSDGSATDA